MLFKPTAASFLALLSFSSAASLKHKRTTESGLTLYGYGGEVNGAQIIYADGTISLNLPLFLSLTQSKVLRTWQSLDILLAQALQPISPSQSTLTTQALNGPFNQTPHHSTKQWLCTLFPRMVSLPKLVSPPTRARLPPAQ